MNDQIKDFVEQNREEFDHLEAPAFDMQRFKRTVAPQAKPQVKTVSLFNSKKWLIAASLLVAVASTWIFFYRQQETKVNYAQTKPVDEKQHPAVNMPEEIKPEKYTESPAALLPVAAERHASKSEMKVVAAKNEVSDYKALQDSSSASIRLLAILDIEKSNRINNEVLNMLSQTLNHDGNTNVRLAALSVLQKHQTDSYAASLLVNSLNKQDDPMVQLGLISLLGKMKNVKIDDQLHAIVDNPETFVAVRDEAYNVLLNQDKL